MAVFLAGWSAAVCFDYIILPSNFAPQNSKTGMRAAPNSAGVFGAAEQRRDRTTQNHRSALPP